MNYQHGSYQCGCGINEPQPEFISLPQWCQHCRYFYVTQVYNACRRRCFIVRLFVGDKLVPSRGHCKHFQYHKKYITR